MTDRRIHETPSVLIAALADLDRTPQRLKSILSEQLIGKMMFLLDSPSKTKLSESGRMTRRVGFENGAIRGKIFIRDEEDHSGKPEDYRIGIVVKLEELVGDQEYLICQIPSASEVLYMGGNPATLEQLEYLIGIVEFIEESLKRRQLGKGRRRR
ncbi:hypothetical protein A3A60_01370 [Candidatus Curtissbacteria bacterium RIFCSPLOWO2_01_FULL_42_26]|uniref:Uncharacterized protein n=1 Tax=Candidatus Curtissbacteria bacterium RIFCSPLOWO2_01_FULL_42_26 TaxID=1797729 RepID=A0A1F5HY32_9BACT|nr:MAG: hypothetical protein A3A60_01370 [Candidatus Curtissbacteria bacterium RIFCSPLOWO2_01_FULL_42_26]